MTDRDEICELMARYCWHVDHLEWAEWLDLYTPDASWRAGDFGPFEGREAMTKLTRSLEKLVRRAVARHFVANELVDIQGDQARMRTYLMVAGAASKAVGTLGEYEVALARMGGRWRIRKLEFNRISAAPAEAAP